MTEINSEMHYEQCYMTSPCDKNWKSDSHVAYPEGTNGHNWGICRECGLECICSRLVVMRNESYERALRDAVEAVKAQKPAMWSNPLDAAQRTAVWMDDATAAIESLGEKP